jgi:acyl-CoA dehydrogenase
VDFNQSIFRMRPGLEDIREGVRAITRDFPDVYWRECDENHRYPVEFIAAMQGGGWLSATLPKEYGGSELGLTAAAAILEEVSASGGGMNATSSIHVNLIGVEPILKFGSSAFKAKYLPLITTGKMSFAFGVTEPDAGSDTTRITTKAVRVDGGYRVYGRKVWTTRAKESDRVLLIVRTTAREDCERPAQGMTLLFADLRQKEVDIRAIPKAGRNAVPSYEVAYDGLFVEDGDVVGEVGRGFYHLLTGLNAERILVAATAVGIARRALQRAVQYAGERVVFQRVIGSNQAVAFPLAQGFAQYSAVSLLLDKVAQMYEAGSDCGVEATMLKYLAADLAYEVADQAVQTHGGMGYAKEFDVERYWREARMLKLAPLTQELALNHLAVYGLGLPRSF